MNNKEVSWLNLANIITILRILLVPLFLFLELNNYVILGYILYIGLAISDKVDGTIARKYNLITNLGKILDPIADKFLVFSGLYMIWTFQSNILVLVLISLIVLREVIITFARLVVVKDNVVAADKYGKLKTVFQLSTTIYALTPIPIIVYSQVYIVLLVLTTIITLFSGIIVLKNILGAK